ncbi:MarR family transcriptional regulator [Luteimicrobium subarcticum]|uniref:DNA-binding MarR family transcriptional regulator n=1 Tax=Luteimicrobium subarcticum TaxID=620910 RepID=A0A2M8W1M5_9MICO|nr:helix-turn-helix domain-containing protein [Luteimicrobium subarcticum]PJI84827.1 DNA-binding MarR family transcriptional regulator [Luteimicrobium subarcticum]
MTASTGSVGGEDDLVRVLVDLAEAFDSVNAVLRPEAEVRARIEPLAPRPYAVLLALVRHPRSTVPDLASATRQTVAKVARALRTLEDGRLVERTRDGDEERWSATSAAWSVRDEARRRCAQVVRYALSGVPSDQVSRLRGAVDELAALGRSLGLPSEVPPAR